MIGESRSLITLLCSIYGSDLSFNEFFWFIVSFSLLPPKYIFSVIFAACRISPYKQISRKDFHTFCNVIGSDIPSEIIDTIFQAIDRDHDGLLVFPEILKVSSILVELFLPVTSLRKRIRQKFFGEHICKVIEKRKQKINEIKQYQQSHNNKFPSLSCINGFLVYVLKYPHPFKYNYEPLSEGEEVINTVIIKLCQKYIGKATHNKNENRNHHHRTHSRGKNRVEELRLNQNIGPTTATPPLQPSPLTSGQNYVGIRNIKPLPINNNSESYQSSQEDNIPLTPTSQRALQSMANIPFSDRSVHPSTFSYDDNTTNNDYSPTNGSTFRYLSGINRSRISGVSAKYTVTVKPYNEAHHDYSPHEKKDEEK